MMKEQGKSTVLKILIGASMIAGIIHTTLRIIEIRRLRKERLSKEKDCNCSG